MKSPIVGHKHVERLGQMRRAADAVNNFINARAADALKSYVTAPKKRKRCPKKSK
jgi:hypothetical protein